MSVEVLLVAGLLAVSLLPLVLGLRLSPSRLVRRGAVVAWLASAAGMVALATAYRTPLAETAGHIPTDRPIELLEGGFVSSDTCRSCHPREYETWDASFHSSMTQEATPQTVIAPWDGVVLEQNGNRFRLERRGAEFWVEALERSGVTAQDPVLDEPRQVVLTTGSHHTQAYWLASGTTRKLRFFDFCYRIAEQRWIPVDAAFLLPPDNPQLKGTGRWNQVCLRCHTVAPQPWIRGADRMDTHVAEFGIACEACHGPAEEHVAANRDPARRYRRHGGDGSDPTIVDPADLPPVRGAEVCGQCHGLTAPLNRKAWRASRHSGPSYRPGQALGDHVQVFTAEEWCWADGMVRVGGREYNGLIRTPCYTHGDEQRGIMTCLSCHVLHRADDDPRPVAEWTDDLLAPGMDGNAACLQCHREYEDERALAAHTHHPADSTGSVCYDCHMPLTTYGLLKSSRSHELDDPDVSVTLATGRPNACNLCHLDRSIGWTAERLAEWYGQPRPEELRGGAGLREEEHTVAASVRWMLSGDAGQRALLAQALSWEPARAVSGTDWMAPFLAPLLEDPYDAVRIIASRTLMLDPALADLDYDFLDPPQQRAAARRAVAASWSESFLSRPLEGGSWGDIPITRDGLQRDVFERLERQRDDRPVSLPE